jgi:predicted RNase H-like HicB family nuclease
VRDDACAVNGAARRKAEVITDYMKAAMSQARYEILADDKSFYGEIPMCPGVYANEDTLEKCRTVLEEVLEEWILFRIHMRLPLPEIGGIKLEVKRVA